MLQFYFLVYLIFLLGKFLVIGNYHCGIWDEISNLSFFCSVHYHSVSISLCIKIKCPLCTYPDIYAYTGSWWRHNWQFQIIVTNYKYHFMLKHLGKARIFISISLSSLQIIFIQVMMAVKVILETSWYLSTNVHATMSPWRWLTLISEAGCYSRCVLWVWPGKDFCAGVHLILSDF